MMMCVLQLQSMAMKVLVAGDVEGNITALFKRVDAVNKKAGQWNIPPPTRPHLTPHPPPGPTSPSPDPPPGPFEMVLCVGSFFGPGNPGCADYKSGR